jgi:menaquinone-dependent protoporphyrinogen oxidase
MTEHITAPDHPYTRRNALLVYSSTHGHTAKIAACIADAMRASAVHVDLRDVQNAADAYPASYDLIVVGASLHKEHHQKEIVDWVAARCGSMTSVPSVFFSVSLAAAEDSEESHATTQRCIDAFCGETGWTPERSESFAGALQYREYDVFTRQLMRMLMRRMGHPTDASHDYDYTDWDAVERFGHEVAALADASVAA